jgi:hypothetical protein
LLAQAARNNARNALIKPKETFLYMMGSSDDWNSQGEHPLLTFAGDDNR